jgi:hypothetical protein
MEEGEIRHRSIRGGLQPWLIRQPGLSLFRITLTQPYSRAPPFSSMDSSRGSACHDICEVGTANCSYACVLRRSLGASCSDRGRFNRAPRPALCSSIISTPAFSKALRTAAAFANVMAVSPSTASARWIVERLTPDSRARSEADHRVIVSSSFLSWPAERRGPHFRRRR